MQDDASRRRWPDHVGHYLQRLAIDGDDLLDAARRRFEQRFGRTAARHIAAYRGYADETGVELHGRVLASRPPDEARDGDSWWDNLLETYRRFESDELPGVALRLRFRDVEVDAVTDGEGYFHARFDTAIPGSDELWDNAMVSLADGTLMTPQPVLQVHADAGIGIISDIDDTILHSSVLHWKTAAQLAFLHNARTRKPLLGVARLYQALQAGADGRSRHPLFYVSSSPWNLYDLLEDFLELNAIPFGPILLRDIGLDDDKFITTRGHGHKLERARELILRFPTLRWVLLGDSGQADAELYTQAAREFGDRIAAIYVRDVDPDSDSPWDQDVDRRLTAAGDTGVPMLRVADSVAIAEHAATLGLLAPSSLDGIRDEVRRDANRPTVAAAASAVAAAQAG